MRYRLRTLLILLAIGPPVLGYGWTKYAAWREEQRYAELLKVPPYVYSTIPCGVKVPLPDEQ